MRSPRSEYLISLPERVLRSATALAAGLLRETGDVALPLFVRRTRLYQNLVDSTLRFLIEQVGQVEGAYPAEEQLAKDFLLRRTAGNGIEMVGLLTFRASPVWVMAALADLSGAGRHMIREISAELQKEGLLEPGASFDTLDGLLDGLERTSARVAETCNTPPLDLAGLRSEWQAIRAEIAAMPAPGLPGPETVQAAWRELQAEAAAQHRTVFELSTMMALSAVARVPEHLRWLGRSAILAARKSGEVFAEALLEHYRTSLREIHETGYLRYWVREFRPYLAGAAKQFSPKRRSLTQRLLRKSLPALIAVAVFDAQAEIRIPTADLRAHVEFLASDVLEGRATPSPGLDVAAEYIAVQFRRAGLKPLPDGTYFQVASPGMRNVIGILPGQDANMRDTYVLLTAHYDHTGVKPQGQDDGDRIRNGANDNASGVASLLETADALARARRRRTVVFIAYYGEEKGLVGSRFYAANPVFPIESTAAQINLEQTGRTDDKDGPNAMTLNVTGFDYSEVADILSRAAKPTGVRVEKRARWSDDAFVRSDNEALAKRGVPAHTVSVSYMFPDYHQPADEWDKLDYENMTAVTDAIAEGVLALANRSEPPHWYAGVVKAQPYASIATPIAKPIARPQPAPAKGTRARRQR